MRAKKFRLFFVVVLCFGVPMLSVPNNLVRIGLAGDVMLGRLVGEKIAQTSMSYPWGDMLPLLRANDLNLVNLETTFTQSTSPMPKVFNFKSDPRNVEALVQGNIHVVNNANNHILDFGVEGLRDTLRALDKAGVAHVGAGMNEQEAAKPTILNVNDIKIGIMGYTDNEPSWKAGIHTPGTNYIQVGDVKRIRKDIQDLRDKVDLLIITIHWGPNWEEKPPQAFVDFAHAIIDAGADILHGHSNHTFQGIEKYHNKLILYQTGDFVDDYMVDPIKRNDRSFLFIVEVDKSKAEKAIFKKVQIIPTIIENMQVNKASSQDCAASIARMKKLSAQSSF